MTRLSKNYYEALVSASSDHKMFDNVCPRIEDTQDYDHKAFDDIMNELNIGAHYNE